MVIINTKHIIKFVSSKAAKSIHYLVYFFGGSIQFKIVLFNDWFIASRFLF